jgi:hypothetical protein
MQKKKSNCLVSLPPLQTCTLYDLREKYAKNQQTQQTKLLISAESSHFMIFQASIRSTISIPDSEEKIYGNAQEKHQT